MSDAIVPPKRRRPGEGAFTWPERPVLASARTADDVPLRLLARTLRRRLGQRPRIVLDAGTPAGVRVHRDPRIGSSEGYRLRIAPAGCEVFARTDAGAYYGLQTLRDLVRSHGERLSAETVTDEPDFARRGVYLDCSRGRVPKTETLIALVEWLASLKVNEVQLYVENVFTWRRHPAIGRGFSPFRPADLLAVQEAAARHHVSIVPSLATFGHMERILGLPEYVSLAELPGHLDLPGGTTLCPGDPGSIRLVADLLDEVLPLFVSEEFNACGDETWELGKGRSRARVRTHGVGRVYVEFLRKVARLCAGHGKRMNVWADILLNHPGSIRDLPEDVVLLNWDYSPDGERIPRTREIAEAGRPLLVCPGTNGWQSHGTRLDQAVANVAVFARTGRRCGAEGLLNTDWGDYGHRNPLGVSLHGFAHGAAHAWNGRRVDDTSFTETFADHVLGSADLGAAIRTLGRADETAGASLYHALSDPFFPRKDPFAGVGRISPIRVPPDYRRRPTDDASPDGSRRVVADMAEVVAAVEAVPPPADPFLRTARDEIVLAARMNAFAARRILAGRALRAGHPVPCDDLRRLSTETSRIARTFETLWRRSHRPSRLRDNLTLFRRAASEAAVASGRRT